MRRREFVSLLGGAVAAWPLAARAQQAGPVRRIGVLMNGAATETAPQSYVAAFVQGLRQLGWTEGQNIRVDIRWNAGDAALHHGISRCAPASSHRIALCAVARRSACGFPLLSKRGALWVSPLTVPGATSPTKSPPSGNFFAREFIFGLAPP